jgi:hypothetical protein
VPRPVCHLALCAVISSAFAGSTFHVLAPVKSHRE